MPTPTKGPRVGGGPAHERLILANLATSLFEHDSITTTEAKAKRLRPLAERLITFAKRGDLSARRRVLTVVRDKGVVHRLFAEIAPDMAARDGGYTRITKIGPRKGDNAPMAVIELVTEKYDPKPSRTTKQAEPKTKAEPETAAAEVPTELAEEASPEESVVAEAEVETTEESTEESTEEAPAEAAAEETPEAEAADETPAEGSDEDADKA